MSEKIEKELKKRLTNMLEIQTYISISKDDPSFSRKFCHHNKRIYENELQGFKLFCKNNNINYKTYLNSDNTIKKEILVK